MRMLATFCVLISLGVLAPVPLAAQESYFYVNPNIGTGFFFGDLDEESAQFSAFQFDNTPTYGANVGMRLNGQIGVEGSFTFMPSDATFELLQPTGGLPAGTVAGFNTTLLAYTANLSYAFASPKTSVAGFVIGGAGGLTIDPDSEGFDSQTTIVFNLGAGLEVPVSDVTLLRLELRDYLFNTDLFVAEGADGKTVNGLVLSGGLSFILQ